jgi:hypothetical protein
VVCVPTSSAATAAAAAAALARRLCHHHCRCMFAVLPSHPHVVNGRRIGCTLVS